MARRRAGQSRRWSRTFAGFRALRQMERAYTVNLVTMLSWRPVMSIRIVETAETVHLSGEKGHPPDRGEDIIHYITFSRVGTEP